MIEKVAEDLRRGEWIGSGGDRCDQRFIVRSKTSQKIDIKFSRRDRKTSGSEGRRECRSFIEVLGNRLISLFESGQLEVCLHEMSMGLSKEEAMESRPYLMRAFNNFSSDLKPDLGIALPNLQKLGMAGNKFTGSIPAALSNASDFQEIDIPTNYFTGNIPMELGNLGNLTWLNANMNLLGNYSVDDLSFLRPLTNCSQLQTLDISYNRLGGSLPPVVGNLNILVYLDVSFNKFSKEIPAELGDCLGLEALYVQGNFFEGTIPDLSKLRGIQYLDLSHNLTSQIEAIWHSCFLRGGVVFDFPVLVEKVNKNCLPTSTFEHFYQKISYQELLNATDGFSEMNLIGSGNFGNVYKGKLGLDEVSVAVKVLNLKKKGASRSFIAECQALRSIRHRNLVNILTACSSIDYGDQDFKALVYEFMPNGNLDRWLHLEDGLRHLRNLSLLQRVNIAIDVASALLYLHHECHIPIIHCDLKPSNILLDDELTARISDFGLARLLLESSKHAFLSQLNSVQSSH
ncbi:hypothetical protein F2P56_032346 [Juglans regia]|uniref:non-specific serine/threonine protein kinase n=1 Tax=Juglans regia TaxID=51240 RepID=A0A833TY29_JUGRE|nr:hypothetical protein F2P56_032346 [Juglans regia]